MAAARSPLRLLAAPLLTAALGLAGLAPLLPTATAAPAVAAVPDVVEVPAAVQGAGTAAVARTAATPVPPVPTGLPAGLEDLAPYVPANSCTPTARPGTTKLGRLLTATYPGTSWGGARACGALPDSEHHDGRAVDWMNSIRNPTQAAQAKALLAWLFAADAQGRPYANARRLGIMYVIWDGHIWGAYSAAQGWRPYSSCASHPEPAWDNTCHRNHVHLSLSWAGAMGRTSYWTRTVAPADYGRCRAADMNWAYGYVKPNPVPCPRYGTVKAPAGASATLKTVVSYSGRSMGLGAKNAGVTAVQRAIGTSATGTYNATTVTAMKAWQQAHHLEATGRLNHATWRALRVALAP